MGSFESQISQKDEVLDYWLRGYQIGEIGLIVSLSESRVQEIVHRFVAKNEWIENEEGMYA